MEEECESESESEDDDEEGSTSWDRPTVFREEEEGCCEEEEVEGDEEGEVDEHLASGLRRNVSFTLGGGLS